MTAVADERRLTPLEWQVARVVCTPKQREALDYWRRGATFQRVAEAMMIDRVTAFQHVKKGKERVREAIESALSS